MSSPVRVLSSSSIPTEERNNTKQPTLMSHSRQWTDRTGLTNKMINVRINGQIDENIRVENCIGFTQVPLGIAGPLTIHGAHQKGSFLGPLATTEATLVASCARGCKAFRKNGVHVTALAEGVSRAPIFYFKTVNDAVAFYHQIPSLEAKFKQDAEKTSRYARLTRLTPHIIGSSVHVKFDYNCGDAAGQNMVTIATQAALTGFLSSPAALKANLIDFHVEGGMSSDKKFSWSSVPTPRGVQVIAWATLDDEACQAVLGLSCARLHRAATNASHSAIRSGMVGNNINTANILAAMFIACGQDAASVLESGWSQLTTEYNEQTRELVLSLFFPSMLVGTVGGGTAYPTQREALELIECAGEGRKWALAETIAAFALALEVSTLSAVANGTFAEAHRKLARL